MNYPPRVPLQGNVALDNEDISALMDEFLVISAKDRVLVDSGKDSKSSTAAQTDLLMTEDSCNTGHEDKIEAAEDEDSEDGGDVGVEDYMPDYFKAKEVAQWDCESILSTYSNLDNHPVRIMEPRRQSRKKQGRLPTSPDEAPGSDRELPRRIVLSSKSGMPVGVLQSSAESTVSDGRSIDSAPENKGTGRRKEESKEEKRERKPRVKEERHNTRVAKSKTKEVFRREALDNHALATRSSGGVAVFRY